MECRSSDGALHRRPLAPRRPRWRCIVTPSIQNAGATAGVSLERLTLLMRWRTNNPALSASSVFEELRADLWKSAAQDVNQWKQPFLPALREDPEAKPLDQVRNRDKIATRFLARLTDAYTRIETVYAAVRCIEGYRLELEQIERMGLLLDELDQRSALLSAGSALIAHIPKDSELARHMSA
ncbi:MAG: hypothetical protein NZM94_16615 [Roseiflexus sp.]|nr:hypothetical protein [Roseiflexus sp.]